MKIYYKYFLRNLTWNFISILFILTAIFWFIQAPKLITLIITNGLNLQSFFILSILILPYIVLTILPFCCFITVIYVYTKFINDKEIVAFETGGLTYIKLAQPAISGSIILCIISYFLSFFLLPYSNLKFYDKLINYRENFASLFLEAGTFNHPLKNVVIYFDTQENSTNLKNLFIFDGRNNQDTSIIAQNGYFHKSGSGIFLTLINGNYIHLDKNRQLQMLYFDETQINLTPTAIELNKIRKMEELYINKLLFPDPNLPKKIQNKYKVEGHRRISWPLYNIVLTMISVSFLLKSRYSRSGNSKKTFIASFFAIASVMLNMALQSISVSHPTLFPILYANIIITILICFMYLANYSELIWIRVRSEELEPTIVN